jgi:hypothetical protein
MKLAQIEPANSRFVAQCLNRLRHPYMKDSLPLFNTHFKQASIKPRGRNGAVGLGTAIQT